MNKLEVWVDMETKQYLIKDVDWFEVETLCGEHPMEIIDHPIHYEVENREGFLEVVCFPYNLIVIAEPHEVLEQFDVTGTVYE